MTPSSNSAFSSPRRRSESNSRNPEPQPYDPKDFFVVIRADKYKGSFFHQKPERGNNYKLKESQVKNIFFRHNFGKKEGLVKLNYFSASAEYGNHRYFMHESEQGRILQRSVDEQMLKNIQEAGQKVFAQRRSRKIEEAAAVGEQDRLSSERPPLNQLQIAKASLAILAFAKKYGRVSHLEKLELKKSVEANLELQALCEKYGISPKEAGMFSATCQKLNKTHGILTGRTHNFIEGTQENGNRLAHTPLEVFQMLERYKNRLSEIEGEKGGPEERLGGSRLSSRLLTTPTFETTYTKTNDEFKLERSWHFQPIIPGAEDPDQDRFDYGRGFSLNSTATTASNPMARKGVAVHKPVAGPARTKSPTNPSLLSEFYEPSEDLFDSTSQLNIPRGDSKKSQKPTRDKRTHSPTQLKADLSSEAQGDEGDGLTFAHTNPSSSEFHLLSPSSAAALFKKPAELVFHIGGKRSPSPQTPTGKSPTEPQQMTENPGRFAKDAGAGNTHVAAQTNASHEESSDRDDEHLNLETTYPDAANLLSPRPDSELYATHTQKRGNQTQSREEEDGNSSAASGSIQSMQQRLPDDKTSFNIGEVYSTSSGTSSPRHESQNKLFTTKTTSAQSSSTKARADLEKSSTYPNTRPRAKSLDSTPLADLDHRGAHHHHELRATSKKTIANSIPHSPSQKSVAATLGSGQRLQQPSPPPSRRDSFNASDSESDELQGLLNSVEHVMSVAQDDNRVAQYNQLLQQKLDTLQNTLDSTFVRPTAEDATHDHHGETPEPRSTSASATSLNVLSTQRDSGKN
jgi:hypothetical protein